MARTIVGVPEFYTDGIIESAGARVVNFHALYAIDPDGSGQETVQEWHYYGTKPPQVPQDAPVITHPALSFPADFVNLGSEADQLIYALAQAVSINNLQLP